MNATGAPGRDPVAEVFDAIAQARRASPRDPGEWTVTVRSRTGQRMARFTLDSEAQVLAFAERVQPLGYRMERRADRQFDFSLERRAANEAASHPHRRCAD